MIFRGRLWRCANPGLPDVERQELVNALMRARRDVRGALASGAVTELADARRRVHAAKVGLGERGPVWWLDGAADLNRRMACNTEYAGWYEAIADQDQPVRDP